MAGPTLREGVTAGLAGAVTVAVWFLIFDVLQGTPFRTPAVLWAVLFEGVRNPAAVGAAPGPVLGYTIAHLVAFLLIGLVAAWLVAGAEREPPLLVVLLIFLGAFEVFFLALISFLARPALGILAWWEILMANFLAALAMLTVFYRGHRPLARTLLGRWVDVAREGIAGGLLGGVVVALWFFVYDTIRFTPLRTPALLGSALFQGLRDPKLLEIRPEVVLGYTVLHLAVFAAFGILVAALLVAAEREPRILLGLFILFWCFELFFLGFVSALDEALVGALLWWNIAIANLLAAAAMIGFFFLRHRSLGARLLERWTED